MSVTLAELGAWYCCCCCCWSRCSRWCRWYWWSLYWRKFSERAESTLSAIRSIRTTGTIFTTFTRKSLFNYFSALQFSIHFEYRYLSASFFRSCCWCFSAPSLFSLTLFGLCFFTISTVSLIFGQPLVFTGLFVLKCCLPWSSLPIFNDGSCNNLRFSFFLLAHRTATILIYKCDRNAKINPKSPQISRSLPFRCCSLKNS